MFTYLKLSMSFCRRFCKFTKVAVRFFSEIGSFRYIFFSGLQCDVSVERDIFMFTRFSEQFDTNNTI